MFELEELVRQALSEEHDIGLDKTITRLMRALYDFAMTYTGLDNMLYGGITATSEAVGGSE